MFSNLPVFWDSTYVRNTDLLEKGPLIESIVDSSLFINDPDLEYYKQWLVNMPMFVYLLAFFGKVFGVGFTILFLLPLVINTVLVYYAYKILRYYHQSRRLSYLGVLFFGLFYWSTDLLTGGGERTLGLVIIFPIVYYALKYDKKSFFWIGVSAFIYPLTSAVGVAFVFLMHFYEKKLNVKSIVWFVLTGGVVLISASALVFIGPEHISYETAASSSEFYEGGSSPVFYSSFFKGIFSNNYEIGIGVFLFDAQGNYAPVLSSFAVLYGFLIVCLVLSTVTLRKRPKVDVRVLLLGMVGIVMYCLATIFRFKLPLYSPLRYLEIVLPLVLVVCAWTMLSDLKGNIRVVGGVLVVVAGVLFVSLIVQDFRYNRMCDGGDLFAEISSLEGEGLIAGNPATGSLVNCVPYFTKRSVFVREETTHTFAYYEDLINESRERNFDFYDAYYSESLDDISDFCQTNNVGYFIVRLNDFTEEYISSSPYVNPYSEYIVEKNVSNAVFGSVPAAATVFGEYYLIDCNKLVK